MHQTKLNNSRKPYQSNNGGQRHASGNKPHGDRPRRFDSLSELENVRHEIKRAPQPQPEPLVFTGAVNAWYKTVRNGSVSRVYLIEVKKDQAVYKNDPNDKHSQSISLAKFMKFYTAE